MRAEDYLREEHVVGGWPAGITTWRLGERWLCRVDNVSPGATVSRGVGTTREEAIAMALESASRRLARTRLFPV